MNLVALFHLRSPLPLKCNLWWWSFIMAVHEQQKGRTIGHNQWSWAMEKRDERIEAYRKEQAKKD